MSSLLREISKRFSRILAFRIGLSGLFLIGVTSASANSLPLQVQGSETGLEFRADGAPTDLLNTTRDSGQFFTDVNPAGETAFSVPGPTNIQLSGSQNQVFFNAPGSTVTLNLQNFVLSGHSTLTLLGDATSTFIFNVTKQFSLSQNAKIVLSGGLQWDHVFFNVLGKGTTVSLSGQSILVGTLTANQRLIKLSGQATIRGRTSAKRLLIGSAAQIIQPPVTSP